MFNSAHASVSFFSSLMSSSYTTTPTPNPFRGESAFCLASLPQEFRHLSNSSFDVCPVRKLEIWKLLMLPFRNLFRIKGGRLTLIDPFR